MQILRIKITTILRSKINTDVDTTGSKNISNIVQDLKFRTKSKSMSLLITQEDESCIE